MAPPASYSLLTELVSSRPTMCPNQVKRHLLKKLFEELSSDFFIQL